MKAAEKGDGYLLFYFIIIIFFFSLSLSLSLLTDKVTACPCCKISVHIPTTKKGFRVDFILLS